MKKLPPIEELRRLFEYDPKTGILTRKISTSSNALAGDEAGCYFLNKRYRCVQIAPKMYLAHRICYAIYHGVDPYPMQIDHINHDGLDNRIDNFRLVSHQENLKNQKKRSDNSSGSVGVSWVETRNKWLARIKANGKSKHLGYFTNKSDAIAARKAAEKKYGYHENHGDSEYQKNDIGDLDARLTLTPTEENIGSYNLFRNAHG